MVSSKRYSRTRPKFLPSYPYVAITLYGPPFQESSGSRIRNKGALVTPHLPHISTRDSVCLVLRSLAVTNRISSLISLPAGTKMFQFPAFLAITGLNRSLIEGSPVRCLHAACRSNNAACHALHQLLSQVIHLLAIERYYPLRTVPFNR